MTIPRQAFTQYAGTANGPGLAAPEAAAARCSECGSRTCDGGEALCVAHEDFVPYEDDDQRVGGWDNPNAED